jgi:hypothetical protein
MALGALPGLTIRLFVTTGTARRGRHAYQTYNDFIFEIEKVRDDKDK